jgi:hypothetical protein
LTGSFVPLHPTLIESGKTDSDEGNWNGLSNLWCHAEHSMVPPVDYDVFDQISIMRMQILDIFAQIRCQLSLELDNRFCIRSKNRHSPKVRWRPLFSYLNHCFISACKTHKTWKFGDVKFWVIQENGNSKVCFFPKERCHK